MILFALLLFAVQDFTQRGFLENRFILYPQKAPNDAAHIVDETLFRYEGFYKPVNGIQLAGAVDLRTDTHHQVERKFRLSWRDRERQRLAAAIRRLSAVYHRGPVTIEAGKQFVRWGKTDILTPTDRFAPRDFLTVVDNDFLPVTAARVTYEKGADTIDVVWSPWLTPSRVPLVDQRWTVVPEGIRLRDAGEEFPGGPQAGIRWNRVGTIEYAFALYRGHSHLPSFDVSVLPAPQGFEFATHRFYPKLLMAGGDFAVPLPWLTLKGEAAHFSSSDDRSDEYVLYVVQLEKQSGEWFFVGGYAGQAVTARGRRAGEFAPDRGLTRTMLGRAGYTIDANRSIAFESALRQNGNGFWGRFEYSQAFGQHWRATASLSIIRGEMNDFLGQYRRNSNAAAAIRYSF